MRNQESSEGHLLPPQAYLLNESTVHRYREAGAAGIERVAEWLQRAGQPVSGTGVDELAREVDKIDLDRPLSDVTAALTELERVYLHDTVYFHHPRYLGHLNCPVVIPAVLGEVVASAINSSLDTWDQSVGATLIEQQMIDWTAQRLGFGGAADGVFTSGGTQSNLQALLLAREEACSDVRGGNRRTQLLPRLRILSSEVSHFSITKAAKLLGLGADAVISVPCDSDRKLRVDALAAELERCRRTGCIPMAVVATAGTTDFGSIDPLPEIAEICQRTGTWLHVDAAYGCGLLVSRHRDMLAGVERADSVTVDYHKSFFQPVSSSALVVRDQAVLRHATFHADYLNPSRNAGQVPNQVDKSIQTTRRFDAVKLWLTLRIMGADAIGELFDEVIELADRAWQMLSEDSRFQVAGRPQLSTVVFRYLPAVLVSAEQCDELNRYAREALFSSGEAVVAGTVVDGRQHLKLTLLNPRTSLHDIAAVTDLIAAHAEDYLSERAEPQGQVGIHTGARP